MRRMHIYLRVSTRWIFTASQPCRYILYVCVCWRIRRFPSPRPSLPTPHSLSGETADRCCFMNMPSTLVPLCTRVLCTRYTSFWKKGLADDTILLVYIYLPKSICILLIPPPYRPPNRGSLLPLGSVGIEDGIQIQAGKARHPSYHM